MGKQSDTVKRYMMIGLVDGMVDASEHPNGYWTRYEDYTTLQTENERLREEVKQLKEWRDGKCTYS